MHLPRGQNLIELQSIDPMGSIITIMWLGMGAGLVLASPVIFYEVWAFVAPGLKENEKRAITPALGGGIFFFLGGCALAYYVLFPVSINVMAQVDLSLLARPSYTVTNYMSLLVNMMFMSGLVCEAPLIVAVLAKLQIVSAAFLLRYWRICVLVATVLGAIFSPGTEVMSMLLFSALLLSLYFISIVFAYVFYPRKKRA
jgi:sec-independent protein translocase protein TatC